MLILIDRYKKKFLADIQFFTLTNQLFTCNVVKAGVRDDSPQADRQGAVRRKRKKTHLCKGKKKKKERTAENRLMGGKRLARASCLKSTKKLVELLV